MKEAFEKIIERFEEPTNYTIMCGKHFTTVDRAIEIVNQVAEEYKSLPIESKSLTEKFNDGWIPCSEDIPKENGWYLVTNSLGVVQEQFFRANHWSVLRDEAVLAWQPLPEPYKPKGEQ